MWRLIHASLEMANKRITSSSVREGAARRILPVGGYTARCMFLMSFLTTSISRLAICNCSVLVLILCLDYFHQFVRFLLIYNQTFYCQHQFFLPDSTITPIIQFSTLDRKSVV